jgi:hypothetical protein
MSIPRCPLDSDAVDIEVNESPSAAARLRATLKGVAYGWLLPMFLLAPAALIDQSRPLWRQLWEFVAGPFGGATIVTVGETGLFLVLALGPLIAVLATVPMRQRGDARWAFPAGAMAAIWGSCVWHLIGVAVALIGV